MTSATAQEIEVRSRFDALEARFKADVAAVDARLLALRAHLGLRNGGRCRLLDLGCGKGRFSARLREQGAEVVGLDLSAAMLAEGRGGPRVRGSARRLPFPDRTFDGVFAVEVLQHVAPGGLGAVLDEACRVLVPGGRLVIVDRNALAIDPARPWLPALALKWIDERRGRWMYEAGGPAKERWFWPGSLQRRLRRDLIGLRVESLITAEESGRWLFDRCPQARRLRVWSASKPREERR
ncbi:hypothetical protein BH23PLA1_BH23PLA1_15730 [soil metagenome]